MAAGDRRGSGSATLAASLPGVFASIEVNVGSLATSDTVVITPSYTAAQTLNDKSGQPVQFYVVKASGKFTIYASKPQTEAILFDYMVYTTA